MRNDRWERMKTIYHRAAELSSTDQASFLVSACGGDDELRREVEFLLASKQKSLGFIENAVGKFAAEVLEASAQVCLQLTAGTRLGPYEILDSIGAGGMGEVYRGHDTRLHRTVAIKVLSEDAIHDPDRRRRFLQEARAASALSHPNIVTMHDIGTDRGVDFFVMEYVPETPLDRLISAKAMALGEVVECGIEIANALAAAHAAGIIHRDIKPANVMVTPQRKVKVLDFGLAMWPEAGPIAPSSETQTANVSLTETGQVMGTLAYMSPEQARGERLDARTDLFSFGAVLYEMATGRRAFPKAWDWTPPPAGGVDPSLYRIILKLVQVNREQRYASAVDVAGDLQRIPQASVKDTQRGLLLVVDDNVANRDMLSRRLQRRGYTTLTAENGSEALNLISNHPIDLVLLDIMMPGIDGLSVLGLVRQKRSITELPIILATAKDQSDDIILGFELGANDYVTKPLDFRVVLARIQTQLALKRATAELRIAHAKITGDLQAAARIQHSLMPKKLPELSNVSFAWTFQPCEELAGDVLDIFQLDDNHVGCYLLDVSGHGVPAALLAVTLSRVLSHMATDSLLVEHTPSGDANIVPPSRVAESLNRRFQMDPEMPQYFTLLYGVLNIEQCEFRYVSAGHPGPLHISRRNDPALLPGEGLAIGWFPTTTYEETVIRLQPGDRLYLYSDGITDAINSAHEFFAQRFVSSLERARDMTLSQSIYSLISEVRGWCDASMPDDDISVLAFEIRD